MVPQALAYVHTEFLPEERGQGLRSLWITFPIGGMAGPLLGGLLTGADLFGLGWRPIFLVNLPVGLLAMIMIAVLMPHRRVTVAAARVDLVGMLLAGAVVISLMVPLIQGLQAGWPWWTVVLLIAFIPLVVDLRHAPAPPVVVRLPSRLTWLAQERGSAAGRLPGCSSPAWPRSC